MSNAPASFVVPSPLSRELGGLVPSMNKKTESSPSPPLGNVDGFLRGGLNPNKYTKLEAADYIKVVDNTIKTLRLSSTTPPPPDVLRRMYQRSLMRKNVMVASLADAEQMCQDWEGALRQMLGEAEVLKISQANCVVDIDEAETVKGKYSAAVARMRMQDFSQHRMGGN